MSNSWFSGVWLKIILNVILGGTVVESMSLDARQACFQHWASRFALSLNVLIYEDNGMYVCHWLLEEEMELHRRSS